MSLSKKAISLLLALACAGLCAAQEKPQSARPPAPDLSGVWELVKDKSYIDTEVRTALPYDKVTVVIAQSEPEIKITRVALLKDGDAQKLSENTFFTDERGEENPFFTVEGGKTRKVGQAETKTRWKGRRLVVKGRDQFRFGGQVYERSFTDTWELSEDGQTLTQTTEAYDSGRPLRIGTVNRQGMLGSPVVKRVYRLSGKTWRGRGMEPDSLASATQFKLR